MSTRAWTGWASRSSGGGEITRTLARWTREQIADPDRVWLMPTSTPINLRWQDYRVVMGSVLDAQDDWWIVMDLGADSEMPSRSRDAVKNPLAMSVAYALIGVAEAVRLGAERSMKIYMVSHADEFA